MQHVKIRRLDNGEGLPLPSYATVHAAGLDLRSAESVSIRPMETKMVSLGFSIELPHDCEAQIRPRSGLAAKHGITVLNSPGTVDSDYRGEMRVILINLGSQTYAIKRGDRIAQMVVSPVVRVLVTEVNELSDTDRGQAGFGSTGIG